MGKKEVTQVFKIMATGGAATPAPPLGPVLGSKGVNPGQFIQKFNAATQNVKGKVVGCIVTVYSDRSFDFEIKNGTLRVYDDASLAAEYLIPEAKGQLLAHPGFYEALKKDKAQQARKYRGSPGKAKATRGLIKNGLLHEVQRRPLSAYQALLEVAHV